jgi:hypothetical protein
VTSCSGGSVSMVLSGDSSYTTAAQHSAQQPISSNYSCPRLPCLLLLSPPPTTTTHTPAAALQVDVHQATEAVPASNAYQGSSRLAGSPTTHGPSASPAVCISRHHRELSARHTASARPVTARLTQACLCGNTNATSAPLGRSIPVRVLATATSPRLTTTTTAGSSGCRARRRADPATPRTRTVASARLTWVLPRRTSVCAHLGLVDQLATPAWR